MIRLPAGSSRVLEGKRPTVGQPLDRRVPLVIPQRDLNGSYAGDGQRARWRAHPRRAALSPWARDVGAVILLVAMAVVIHLPGLHEGLIPVEDDTQVFYFPLLQVVARSLSNFTFPLWTPGILTGYPLFADGEAGFLYPLHVLVLPWLGPERGLVALQVLHSFLASAFAYALLRTLGTGLLGAIVAGLTYGYSGFAAGQIVHQNVLHAMVWLPLELVFVERAFRSDGLTSWRYAVLGGAAVGIQALATHVQVTLMSALVITVFSLYRGLTGHGVRAPTPRPWLVSAAAGLLRAAGIVLTVGVVGLGLSAVQLIPLAELGSQNYRWDGVGARLAATNSVWPGDLLTLLLPRLHDTATGGFWGPWVKWETVLYVGVLPLLLAIVGLFAPGAKYRPFFGGLALVSLALTLGPNAPASAWGYLHDLPGFEVLKSPGRFSLPVSLALAVLAAYGADWLSRTRPWPRLGFAILLVGLLLVVGAKIGLGHASAAFRTPTDNVLLLVLDYVTFPGIPEVVDGSRLTAASVSQLAATALAPNNPVTAWQLFLFLGAFLAVAAWLIHRRLKGPATWMAVVLIMLDLGMVAATSHPNGRVTDLRPTLPNALLLDDNKPFRVYTPSTVDEKRTQVEPNRLLATGIEEANGYSSLVPDRHSAYVAAVQYADDQLMDLWNVRYVVRRKRPRLLPSYGGTSFHPDRPLLSRDTGAAARGEAFLPDGGPTVANEVRLISAFSDGASVADGSPIAQVRLETTDGSERVLTVEAGRDVSDTARDVPGNPGRPGQVGAEGAFQYPRDNPESRRFGEQLYYGRLPINPAIEVRRVLIEIIDPNVGLEVSGLGLYNADTGEVTQAREKAKYQEVYRDKDITIMRNADAMPRAFLVGSAIAPPPGGDALLLMQGGRIDLRQTAVLEEPIPPDLALPSKPAGSSGLREAVIESYLPERVAIQTEADQPSLLVFTDAYFPGWSAQIDGQSVPIVRADYLFRGVVLPLAATR